MATADIAIRTPAKRNKRLSQGDRKHLISCAKKVVEASEDSGALDGAYSAAASAVRAAVETQFPPKDMKVLAKYDASRVDSCIYVSRGYGDRDQFCFRADDAGPMRPSNGNCRSCTFMLEGTALEAFDAFKDAEKKRDANIKQRLSDYRALIGSVSSFNDVAAVWPEAEALREVIVGSGSALVVLNNDVIERIKRETAERLAA